ncbi:Uncharacterised protein [Legionella israelensis]|nr:hypothetical protein [Legionella israelensis]STX57432.1 Uncharacterised protein [Legionella israelensis]
MTDNPKRSRREFWQSHNDSWEVSGLTQAVYCEQQGISHSAFCYWRGRLRPKASKAQRTSPHFLAVKSAVEPTSANTPYEPAIQLMLPNGVRLGISGQTDKVILREV